MIDTSFDFTTDTPGFWDGFWERNYGLGAGGNDPDTVSKTLQQYHRFLWSKPLPNGEVMDLSIGDSSAYLTWNDFRFGSDSITASFRYLKNKAMIEEVKARTPDYTAFMEGFLRKAYTIGGEIIFPKRRQSINQRRGCHPAIKDRWDLTLECIRRYYRGEDSPLYETLNAEKEFFSLFVDFKGYVDFFFLQDCVTADYKAVKFWLGTGDFNATPLPQTVDEYQQWIEKNLEFVALRNQRIKNYCSTVKMHQVEQILADYAEDYKKMSE